MDIPDIPSSPSPRPGVQLNGSRPTSLKVHKNSGKIRKPPPPAGEAQRRYRPPPPIIIYTESPKIIRVEQHEFKSVVQRLTGPNSSSSSMSIPSPSTSSLVFQENGGVILPPAAQPPGMFSENLISMPLTAQDSFPTSYDSDTDLLHVMNKPSPKYGDIFSTLFDI